MSKRTPEETLAAIESQAADDDMDEVLAMTPEERDRELAAAGFDLAAVDAKADALFAATQAPTSAVTPLSGAGGSSRRDAPGGRSRDRRRGYGLRAPRPAGRSGPSRHAGPFGLGRAHPCPA